MRKEKTSPQAYESPQMEVMEIAVEQAILQSSIPDLEEEDWI